MSTTTTTPGISLTTTPGIPPASTPGIPPATTPGIPPATTRPVTSSTLPTHSPTGSSSAGIATSQTNGIATGQTNGTTAACPTTTCETHASTIAGSIVGSVVGVSAIMLLAFWLYFRATKKGNHRREWAGGLELSDVAPRHQQAHQQARRQERGGHQQSFDLEPFLLEPTPDKVIESELSSVIQLMEQHVENSYHTKQVPENQRELVQALERLGFGGGGVSASPEYMTSLALDGRTRRAALRAVLSFTVFSAMEFRNASRGLSILPPSVVDFARMGLPTARKNGNQEATARATTQWRVLSAYLLHPHRSERSALVPNEAVVAPQAAALAGALNGFLAPFARAGQAENLQDVVLEAARLGYMLFSHPSEWRFEHAPIPAQGGGAGGGRLVVVGAGLIKVSPHGGSGAGTNPVRSIAPPVVLYV